MMKIMMLMIRVMMMTLVLRARLIRSFSLRTVANRGRLWYHINVCNIIYQCLSSCIPMFILLYTTSDHVENTGIL